MQIKSLHKWNLSYSRAVELQKSLAGKISFAALGRRPRLVGGLDCAFTRDGSKIVACAVVLRMPDFSLVEKTTASRKLTFPYIPGLLSFREAPVCIAAVKKLKHEPDVFIVDGQGIAHPRRLGLAAHLGLFFNKPTVGCAKSRLTGEYEEPRAHKGAYSFLKDGNEVIGAVVRTRDDVKPLFVSVGNKCRLQDAIDIVLACTVKYRLPEPSRLAHQLVSRSRLRSGYAVVAK